MERRLYMEGKTDEGNEWEYAKQKSEGSHDIKEWSEEVTHERAAKAGAEKAMTRSKGGWWEHFWGEQNSALDVGACG